MPFFYSKMWINIGRIIAKLLHNVMQINTQTSDIFKIHSFTQPMEVHTSQLSVITSTSYYVTNA